MVMVMVIAMVMGYGCEMPLVSTEEETQANYTMFRRQMVILARAYRSPNARVDDSGTCTGSTSAKALINAVTVK